jgi:hypothetical protein
MAKVEIFFRGIGMIHHKDDGLWRVLFPFDDCHTVKFTSTFSEKEFSLASPGRNVRIRAVEPTSVFKIGERFDDFLDIASEVSHQDGVRIKDEEGTPFVLLTMENAEMLVGSHTYCRYQLLDKTNVLTHPKEIAYSGKAVIEAKSVVVEADGVDGFPLTFDEDARISFDNICLQNALHPNNQPISDLELLYDAIEDAAEPGKKVTIDRDPAQKPEVLKTDLNFAGITDLDNILPGQKGLPCNVVKASRIV